MIKHALEQGVSASYVLMDSWFTFAPLIQAIREQGLDVIGMVKNSNPRYLVNKRLLSVKALYQAAGPLVGQKGMLRTIQTYMIPNIQVKVVFVRHRTKKNEWLAILRTDCSFSEKKLFVFTVLAEILRHFSNVLPCSAYKKNFKAVPMIY